MIGIDLRWRARSVPLRDRVETLIAELLKAEAEFAPRSRKRRKKDLAKFRRAAEVILCNQLAIALAAPRTALAVRRHASATQLSTIFGQHFNQIIDLMAHLDLVVSATGYRYSRREKRCSSVCATDAFDPYLQGLSWHDLRLSARELILRGPKDDAGKSRSYRFNETDDTRRMRREMREINAMLLESDLTLGGQSEWANLSDPDRFGLQHVLR